VDVVDAVLDDQLHRLVCLGLADVAQPGCPEDDSGALGVTAAERLGRDNDGRSAPASIRPDARPGRPGSAARSFAGIPRTAGRRAPPVPTTPGAPPPTAPEPGRRRAQARPGRRGRPDLPSGCGTRPGAWASRPG